jgi:hypothetical protein
VSRGKRAAVLGCGPAGVFAAQGLVNAGWRVQMFSKKRRSEMFGAQYLHAPIPGLSNPDAFSLIEYVLQGSVDGYRAKVYGPKSQVEVSPSVLAGSHRAWDIRAAYYLGFDAFLPTIEEATIDPAWMLESGLERDFDLIVSSIPAPGMCYRPGEHYFTAQTVWAIGDAPERGIFCPIRVPDNTVFCNGEKEPSWYRASNVFGYKTAEWPVENKPPVKDVAEVTKPIGTNCNCFAYDDMGAPIRVMRVGRYGRWDKSELSHRAYERMQTL